MNLKVRLRNKMFWFTFFPAVSLLIQAVLSLFGFTFDTVGVNDKLLVIINAVFGVLAILGIVNDPTTEGISDSKLAMTYDAPKAD